MRNLTIMFCTASLACAMANAEAAAAAQPSATKTICPVTQLETVRFAAAELARYLSQATGNTYLASETAAAPPSVIRVGVAADFPGVALPPVANPELDDAIFIDVHDDAGIIAGANPRATLIAVYRYLTALGFRWVRPGADGEIIPKLTAIPPVSLKEVPSYRHRGICIEGTNSEEQVRTLIDWMPKLGFNSYFIQFEQAYTFFERWYAHDRNPNLKGDHPTVAQVEGFVRGIESEVERRGMLYHKVGHGWTCLPFGIEALGWERVKTPPPPDVVPYLAEVNGVRGYSEETPLNTNLCYSNPEVRKKMADFIADYAQKHPAIDYLHVWLADGWNNHCECANCRAKRPSDWYVTLLNELDATLAARQLNTRIVFLIYVDLLWPPATERIAHPDRFVLMFAPYTRGYDQPYRVGNVPAELPPFELNKLTMPDTADGNVAFLKAWQSLFQGDSFDYDYHIFNEHENLGQMNLARVLYEDMKNLKDLGLNGNVSCQPQRVFFPTGILMTVMGRTLWNRDLSFDEIANDYFTASFGADGAACLQYVETITSLFHRPQRARRNAPAPPPPPAEDFERLQRALDEFAPVIARNQYLPDPGQARSWQLMQFHAGILRDYLKAHALYAADDKPGAAAAWKETMQRVWDREPELQNVLDVCLFDESLGSAFSERRRRNPDQ